jgi:crotonobetainyl-CoA:carnitine CoA-transferase CaiB-like acyl-CoA transferase
VTSAIDTVFSRQSRADLIAALAALGVPAGQVRTFDEVYGWEQTRSQGLVVQVEHSTLGRLALPGPPLRYDDAPPVEHRAPPALGEHTAAILRWLDTAEGGEA